MKLVRDHIQKRQIEFAKRPFFQRLDEEETPHEALSFVRGLTFFVMVFQDVLRLNEARVEDPTLRAIARHHRREDTGHDAWFLHDLTVLDGHIPDVREVFADEHVVTRDAAYAIIAETLSQKDDRGSIAMLYVLESTGHVFFERVVRSLERRGVGEGLLYFARGHFEVEIGHEMFEEHASSLLDSIALDESARDAILASVDRGFDAITRMIDALDVNASTPPLRSSVPPVSMTIPRAPLLPSMGIDRRHAG